ncbi:MAG: DUF3048 domain-containing protein [Clostridiales bacterium]|nr:DUF3048 domain-containing protein [Clostridiales bacterium]
MSNNKTTLRSYGTMIKVLVIILSVIMIPGFTSSCSEKEDTDQSTPVTEQTASDTAQTDVTEASVASTSAPTTLPASGEAINPLTGQNKMDVENVGNRSIAIVINNHIASLPQRGINRADVIYEYEAEGGVTRLLAVFSDASTIPEIGSIRSARVVAADLAAGTNSIFVHFGSNKRVPDRMSQYGIQDIDGNIMCASSGHSVNGEITLPEGLFFYRDDTWRSERAIEHTAVTNGSLILGALEYKGLSLEGDTPMLFDFVESNSPSLADGEPCTDLNIYFSLGTKDSNFVYDEDVHLYSKYQFNGTPQIDEITGEIVWVKNVFVLFAHIEPHGDSTLDVYLEDGGDGYYISEGKIINITWEKDSPNSLIKVYDDNGDPVQVNAGRSYINVVRRSRASKTSWN